MKSPSYSITRFQGQWMVSCWDEDGDTSTPKTLYPTPELAIARLMQLMGIKISIEPQNYPERICIGEMNGESV